MKRIIILLIAMMLLGQGASLFAQQQQAADQRFYESDFYFFNFPIEKVYAYRLGYVVMYRTGANEIVRTHIPYQWFFDIGGTGELIYLSSGSSWPSMTVYYENGAFSHVRLRLRRERNHESWGVIPLHVNLDDQFLNVTEVELRF